MTAPSASQTKDAPGMRLEAAAEVFRLARPFAISRGARTEAHVLTVRASCGGAEGRGECVPYARYGETMQSVAEQIASLPESFARAELREILPAGAARNAVDCALWDLEAKRAGRRVWELAGLPAPKPRVTAYTLSLDAPGRMREQARANAGRPLLKVKLGTPDDIPRLEAVREGAPEPDLVVDANEGWSAEQYADYAPHLRRLGVSLVEQPLPAGADGALLEMARPVPVCADESCHDRADLAGLEGKYDAVCVKLDKAGGLTEALDLAAAARARGFAVMAGCMVGSSLAMAPATLVAQSASVTDLDGPLLLAEDRRTPLVYDDAGVHPPKRELWG